MFILAFFTFLAGIATVLSPCVIPVLPALLSASGRKGRLHPLGVIIGLIISFTFFTLALTALVHSFGLSANFLRYLAIAILALFGLVMIFPALGDLFSRLTAPIASLGTKAQEQSQHVGTGLLSGLILGAALGLIWTPCAGPILAAITTLVATNAITFHVVFLTLLYSLGAAVPMFLIIYGGQRALSSSRFLARHSEGIRKFFGFLMLLTALTMATHLDVKFQQMTLSYLPVLAVEDTPIVREELNKLRQQKPTSAFGVALNQYAQGHQTLPKIAPAPDFVGITEWINSPPLTMNSLKGKVVLIDFWTYSCINCIRTFPYLKHWNETYKDKGLVIVGIHTPEFEFEKNPENVKDAVKRFGITYPVAMDNDYLTWQAYNNSYWPAHYLIDQEGILRQFHFGEGKYGETENAIRELLGLSPLTIEAEKAPVSQKQITPETYLGYKRGKSYTSETSLNPNQASIYPFSGNPKADQVSLQGPWQVNDENIISTGSSSTLALNFQANRVYLVLGGNSSFPMTVELDGKPLPKENWTQDMNAQGEIFVKGSPRKYDIVNMKGKEGRYNLILHIPEGISAYAFTFGDEP
jgi:cytochrome c biogenesis protein CcdA/thiol-disulfide isomerase/thioredoxin